ncbi:MAG: hypothetical protein WC497_04925 [Patescibacteria group bacterium]
MNTPTNKQKLLQEVDALAVAEIEKNGLPPLFEYREINAIGERLAKQLGADIFIVQLGTRLMDIKVGEAVSKNIFPEHIAMSVLVANEVFEKYQLDTEIAKKVLNCIEAHHATVPYSCLEAEICANADAHKFLLPKLFIKRIYERAGSRTIKEALDLQVMKMEEKHKIVSLDICKKELEENYQLLKKFIAKIRQDGEL